jgi:hypothetical protein
MAQLLLCQWREERYPFNCRSRYSAYLSTGFFYRAQARKSIFGPGKRQKMNYGPKLRQLTRRRRV